MDDFYGYKIGLFVNNSSLTFSPNLYSFSVSDTIYSPFPTFELNFPDNTGLFLELGNFTQGVLMNVKFGVVGGFNTFDTNFRSSQRDALNPTTGTPGLNGNLLIKALHESFYKNRKAPNIALKEMTVADAVKKLFPTEKNITVENTNGKIEAYAFDDPYRFTKDILLPQATNGKIIPFVFFRNLLDEMHFESIGLLERQAPSERLSFGGEIDEDNAYNVLNSFLPFNEKLGQTLIDFAVRGKILKNDLTFESVDKGVATDAKYIIPVVIDTRIHHASYFHRQFNPKVEYSQLNNALLADAMRAGFFVDKALVTLPLHSNLVAGKTVDVAVSILDSEDKAELSETFSGRWLVEQSFHSWDGLAKQGHTKLILCRSSMKPRRDSIIMDKAFKN